MEKKSLKERRKEAWSDITQEEEAALEACQTPKDFLAFMSEGGFPLPDEMLDAAAGGVRVEFDDVALVWEVTGEDGEVVGVYKSEESAQNGAIFWNQIKDLMGQ